MTLIIDFLPEITSAEESPLEVDGKTIAWHVVLFDKHKNALGGGFNPHKETARRIAIAEVAERKIFKELSENSKSNLLVNTHPTSCGFAAGFQSDKTRQRAIAEAVERWAWSKWIDEGFLLTQLDYKMSDLSPSSQYFHSFFDSVIFFNQIIDTSNIPNFVDKVILGVAIGIKDGGVFPGSRVAVFNEEIWDHAMVEAWRHLEISKKYKGKIEEPFPYGRIFYFSKNADIAFNQISKANNPDWPKPEPLLILEHKTGINELHLWRALMKDYISWGTGSETRFVY